MNTRPGAGRAAPSSAFERLHPSVRYLITEVLRFPGLRPVQEATIDPVLEGRDMVVLAPTAGGKTESAFFPVLSRIISEGWGPVPVLYVSPLRALLNNQEGRVTRMAEALGLGVAKWHGDVSSALKKAALAEPPHVLLITPESLEVLLITAPERAEALLSAVKIVIVDEVHALAGDPRGAHLLSVLERLQLRSGGHIQRIGLSATVGNPDDLARWLQGTGADTQPSVISPPRQSKKPTFRFFSASQDATAARIVDQEGRGLKRLVFVEGRRQSEALAGAITARGTRAWVHHSSVGKSQRDEAEAAFEWTKDAVLVATSSMELGIDVGDLDQVYQVDAPMTVSSLAQRLGRSGRREGTTPQMGFLLGAAEDLLVAIAVSSLFEDGWVEPVEPSTRLWTVLVHQLFANLLETGGLTRAQLIDRVRRVPSFVDVTDEEHQGLIQHLVQHQWLDELDGALMLGTEGERVFGGRNFFKLYAVFDTGETFTVRHGQELVGTLDRWFVFQLSPQRPVFRLAGKAWKMVELDPKRSTLRVVPADKGAAPQWTGRAGALSRTVCERILDVVLGHHTPEHLDDACRAWLAHVRDLYADVGLDRFARPVTVDEKRKAVWHTFAGTGINSVLARLIEHFGGPTVTVSNLALKSRGSCAALEEAGLRAIEALAHDELPPLDDWAEIDTEKRTAILSGFQQCLPAGEEQEFLRAELLAVEEAAQWSRDRGSRVSRGETL